MKHTDQIEMTPEQIEKVGREEWCFRIIKFENGLIIDGEINFEQIIISIALSMIERKDLKKVIQSANKLYKVLKNDPIATLALKAFLSNGGRDPEDCQCPVCQMRRQINKLHNDN